MYINDDDFYDVAEQIKKCCDKHAIICIHVTSALTERLTLKIFFLRNFIQNITIFTGQMQKSDRFLIKHYA